MIIVFIIKISKDVFVPILMTLLRLGLYIHMTYKFWTLIPFVWTKSWI